MLDAVVPVALTRLARTGMMLPATTPLNTTVVSSGISTERPEPPDVLPMYKPRAMFAKFTESLVVTATAYSAGFGLLTLLKPGAAIYHLCEIVKFEQSSRQQCADCIDVILNV